MTHEILASTQGLVWKVLASAGTDVSAGDEILILEVMKMEIPITAPASGVISAVLVDEGAAVTEGQLVARLESR